MILNFCKHLSLVGMTMLALGAFYSFPAEAAEETKSEVTSVKEPTTDEKPLHFFDMVTNIPGDYAAFGKNVFQWNNWPYFAGVGAATAAGISTDYGTWISTKHLFDNSSPSGKEWIRAASKLGKGDRQILLAGILAAGGFIFRDKKTLRVASQIVEVVVATGISTQFLKHIFCRQSPDSQTDTKGGRWQFFTNPAKYRKHVSAYDAFPSGHVATAFATARVLELSYPEQKWVPYAAYSAVALAGFGMVATSGHWYGDYPLAIALGYNFAKAVTRNNPEVRETTKPNAGEINIWTPGNGVLGLLYSKTF